MLSQIIEDNAIGKWVLNWILGMIIALVYNKYKKLITKCVYLLTSFYKYHHDLC